MTSEIPQTCRTPLTSRKRKILRMILSITCHNKHDQEGYDNESSNFASDFNGFTYTTNKGAGYIYTDPSTFESSDYNGNSDTTVVHPVKESETSTDELALDAKPKTSNKRRIRVSEKTVSKAARKSNGRSRRRDSKR
jgi:hypothetical protein